MKLMQFPREWEELGMYPEELFEIQINHYKPGHEEGSEHDRNGAFHWWLKKNPNKNELINLAILANRDPDKLMGDDIKKYIRKSKYYDKDVEKQM